MTPFRQPAVFLSTAFCSGLLLCGCGNPGSPLPPSLLLPQPVTDLSAARTGNAVTLHWTMPRRATDRVKLTGDQRAIICRALAAEPCTTIGVLLLDAGQQAEYTDPLPIALATGAPRLLRYEVHLQNHAKHEGGVSNLALTAAGWAPPTVRAIEATPAATGIAVRWQAPADPTQQAPASAPTTRLFARLRRDRVPQSGDAAGKQNTKAGPEHTPEQPMQQTLEAPEHASIEPGSTWQPDYTVDAQATLNRSYRYTVQLVEQVTLQGHVLEVAGLPDSSGVIAARDVFPPAVPLDLAAVANSDGGTIDLSWAASSDQDTAGYTVYRRDAASPEAPRRVSGTALLPSPAWSDSSVKKGVHYAYSITATDESGNESARSAEVTETLPQ